MNDIKKCMLLPMGICVLLLCCVVGIEYKKNPYLVNIQYQSQQNPEQDGVEKIIVSYIRGVQHCTWENYEYNAERDRYEHVIDDSDNSYLNLYLNPFQTFRCNLEYRLKYEDSIIDQSDQMIVTIYKGSKPIQQQSFPLHGESPKRKYNPDLPLSVFMFSFWGSYVLCMISLMQIVRKKSKYIVFSGGITGFWGVIWFVGKHMNVGIDKIVTNNFIVILVIFLVISLISGAFYNSFSKGTKFVVSTFKRLLPPGLFLIITCCLYIPSSLFLGNINEFAMPYYRIGAILLPYAVLSLVVLLAVGMSIGNDKGQYIYSLILFGAAAGFYLQSNFLNPKMPELDGEEIDWNQFTDAKIYSRAGWLSLFILLLVVAFLTLWKNMKAEKAICYVSGLLSLTQIFSLGVLIFTCRMNPNLCWAFAKEGQFVVGDDNIIVFMVDTLQTDTMQNYIVQNENSEKMLEGFTFFTNTIGGGATTEYAVPLTLTGVEHDPMQKFDDYQKECWEEGYLLQDLKHEKYDVRLYTDQELIPELPTDMADNICETSGKTADNKFVFLQKMLQLTNLYMMPLDFKSNFYLTTREIQEDMKISGSDAEKCYIMDDTVFYNDFVREHLKKRNGRVFRFYHLWGVHKPYEHDELFHEVSDGEVNEEDVFNGIMMLIESYIEELKRLGVYDETTFVIMGDHGRTDVENAAMYPAILVKRAGENHSLQYSDNPVCFRNLVATMGSEIKDNYTQYGPNLFDISKESDVRRLQTLCSQAVMRYTEYKARYEKTEGRARFIVDDSEGKLSYYEWNPYEINKIRYDYGDVIDFTASGSYADKMTERLYPDQKGRTASDELTVCFELPEEKTGNLELSFIYSKVYNNTQKVRIYMNGFKVGDIMCTTGQRGEKTSIIIPQDYIKEKPVVLRMVFPNAVTPNQIDRTNEDKRVLSVTFDKMWLDKVN